MRYDNPKEFFGYVNKHTSHATLSTAFSNDGHFVTNDEDLTIGKTVPSIRPQGFSGWHGTSPLADLQSIFADSGDAFGL